MSETESYSGSEDLQEHEQRPRKMFSLFGRKHRNEREYEHQEGTQGVAMNRDQHMQEDYARGLATSQGGIDASTRGRDSRISGTEISRCNKGTPTPHHKSMKP